MMRNIELRLEVNIRVHPFRTFVNINKIVRIEYNKTNSTERRDDSLSGIFEEQSGVLERKVKTFTSIRELNRKCNTTKLIHAMKVLV